ncbi:bilirubin utilization transcriptional regulator BilQ [Proteocatella sphenisci]|uniref:bilirubin utilization transcriptional regulator BilQ n=1 Tax=Proteocatella sphenisci TaxID=181070 RepID=UPI00049207BE|nr:bilirubin utilization transcriptional regulator BilQ [Proteocatella sphenisci]
MQHTLSFFVAGLQKDFSEFCNERLQDLVITKGLLYFILYIGKHPNCSPSNLSQELHFDSGHTTRSIDKLVKTGFVLRKKSENDKRAYILKLTENGNKVFESSYLMFSQWDEKIFKDISTADRQQLISLLEKLVKTKGDFIHV